MWFNFTHGQCNDNVFVRTARSPRFKFRLKLRRMLLSANQVSNKTFDYIVIGKYRVRQVPIPALIRIRRRCYNHRIWTRFDNPQYDWAFQTVITAQIHIAEADLPYQVPQKSCKDKSFTFNRGKGLGEALRSTFYNIIALPSRTLMVKDTKCVTTYPDESINSFGELGTRVNWELLSHLCESEHFIQPVEGRDNELRAGSPWLTGDGNLGINRVKEPFSGDTNGTWLTPLTIDPIEHKYYQPNASRKNLTVVVNAHVTKLVTELDQSGCATAVEVLFISEEVLYTVRVGKEVILSAGTIMSPQILELSGIGDKQYSNKPVFKSSSPARRWRKCARTPVRQRHRRETFGTKFFGLPPTCMTFIPLASISPAHEALQKSLANQYMKAYLRNRSPHLCKSNTRSNSNTCKIKSPVASLFCGHCSGLLQHITSSDPLVPPSIDPNYFDTNMIKFCRKILDQEPLKKLLTGIELTPGPAVQTDEQISDFVKSVMGTTWHTVGSCSMLPLSAGGVVDNKLKVYNTTNVRVVDMSVVPLHIGAHTQSTAYALGELGADIIKGKVLSF
ncbi:alcohol oxidase [Mycena leptocephala]|nr:alcohol oxidase [Mycena leptocephala]